MMYVAVVTRGRVGNQRTLDSLKGAWGTVGLFCPGSEVDAHQEAYPWVEVWAQPDEDMTISEKRPWVLRHLRGEGYEKVLMLDDDLRFYERYWPDGSFKLRPATADVVTNWFFELEAKLSEDLPHAGFGARGGNHTQPSGEWVVGRMMLALGYHIPTVLDNAFWGRVRTREDMDITLQLLKRGYPNAVTHDFVVDQSQYGSGGGCSDERTVASSDEDAYVLAELHPGLVRVVRRTYKNVPRKEVICQWQKALAIGTQRRARNTVL